MLLVTALRGAAGGRDLVAAMDRRQAVAFIHGDATAHAMSLAVPGTRLVRCVATTAATALLDLLLNDPPRSGQPVVLLETEAATCAVLAFRLVAAEPGTPALAGLEVADAAHLRAAEIIDAGPCAALGPVLRACGGRAGSDLLSVVGVPPPGSGLAPSGLTLAGLAQLVLAVQGRRVPAAPDGPGTCLDAEAVDLDATADRPIWSRYWPPPPGGARTALALLADGAAVAVVEAPCRQPDGIRGAEVAPHAFAVRSPDAPSLVAALAQGGAPAAWPGPARDGGCEATLLVREVAELPRVAAVIGGRVDASASGTDPASGSSFVLDPIGPAPVAFVFSGFGTAHPGMLRRLTDALPGLADDLEATFGPALRRVMPTRTLYPRRVTRPLAAQQLRGTGVEVAAGEFLGHAVYTWIAREMLGLSPAAAMGISLGGAAVLPALCRQPGWMASFATDPGGLIDLSAQLAENGAQDPAGAGEGDWTHWWVVGPAGETVAALARDPSLHLLVRCHDQLALVGGPAEAIAAFAKANRFIVRRTASGMRHLHTPMIAPAVARLRDQLAARYLTADRAGLRGIDVYVSDRPVRPGASSAALEMLLERTTASLCQPVDVPAMTRAAYGRGVRVFVGVGCRDDTIDWIGRCLRGLPHLAVPLGTTKLDPWSALLSAARLLRSHSVLPAETPFDQVMRTPA